MFLFVVNLYNGKIEFLSIEVKLFRWIIILFCCVEYNLIIDVIVIIFYIIKMFIDKL